MAGTDKERAYLSSLYDGYSWHEKVAGWSDEQVIAVYLRFQRDGPPKKEPKVNTAPLSKEEAPKSRQEDSTLRLFE